MKCWSEGDLRAFIDRELPPEEMDRVSVHLETCSACGDHWAELAGRASRVTTLLSDLAEMEPAVRVVAIPRRARSPWQWVGAAAALAAGLSIWMVATPKRAIEIAATSPEPAPVVKREVTRPEPVAPVVSLASATPAGIVPANVSPARRSKRPPSPKVQLNDTFLALDNDPIEAGVVLRVALGPREVPADVIIDADGRPRAIRLVDFKPNH